MKALIATDGSPCSFEAVAQLSRMLTPARDEIVLYYSPPEGNSAQLDLATLEQGRGALADAIFAEAMKHLPQPWQAKVQTIVGAADPRTDILRCAADQGAEIIGLGARGLEAMARVLLGSVSRSVSHAASMPVFVAHTSQPKKNAEGLRVLVACESAKTGLHLAKWLGRFTWPEKSTGRIVTVVPTVLGGTIPIWLANAPRSDEVKELIRVWVEEQQTQIAHAEEELKEVVRLLPDGLQPGTAKVLQGHAAAMVIEEAHNWSCNLIVVGSKASTPLGRLLIGSTCEAVLNRSPCSVLVIHHD